MKNNEYMKTLMSSINRNDIILKKIPGILFIFEVNEFGIPAKLLFYNENFEKVVRFEKEDLYLNPVSEFFTIESLNNFHKLVDVILEEDEVSIEFQIYSKDNTISVIELHSCLVEINKKEIIINHGYIKEVREDNEKDIDN